MPSSKKDPLVPKASGAKPFELKPVPPAYVLLNPFTYVLWLLDFVLWFITDLLGILSRRAAAG